MVANRKKLCSSVPASGAPLQAGVPPAVQPIAYGILDATAVSGLSRTTLYEEMDRGALAYVKVGSRRLILRDDLVAFLTGRRVVSA